MGDELPVDVVESVAEAVGKVFDVEGGVCGGMELASEGDGIALSEGFVGEVDGPAVPEVVSDDLRVVRVASLRIAFPQLREFVAGPVGFTVVPCGIPVAVAVSDFEADRVVAGPDGVPVSGGYDLTAVVGKPVAVFQGERPSLD